MSLEERPGWAGALRTLGGLGGHLGAPYVLNRQAELDEEAAPGRVDRGDGPAVKLNGPMHDRQAEADATGAAIPGVADAVERLEDVGQRRVRDAAAVIADPDADARRRGVRVAPHADRDRGALARVPDRVAHHVLDGAVQQLGIAEHDGLARLGHLDLPAAALRLERGILRHLAHNVREVDRLPGRRGGSASQSGQHQELPDQRVQALGFALDPVEDGLILAPLLARETERDVETRQWRAELVRNVAQ